MSKESDIKFLKQAIDNSKRSMEEGNFPAGGIVVKDNEVISSEVSSPYPGLFHADSKAISKAFEKIGLLNGATLYVGLEPCLMCTGVIYWSGLRRIVFAIPKSEVSSNYYETSENTTTLVGSFNEKLEIVHLSELQSEALEIVREWEEKNGFKE